MSPTGSRPVHELTEADFQRHPVWRFVGDAEEGGEADESHAEPAPSGLREGEYASFMVRATFLLKNGQTLPGAVQVDLLGPRTLFTPAFAYVRGKTLDPLAADAETRISRITKVSDARPASWSLDAPFAGESEVRTGSIAQSVFFQALVLLVRLVSLRFTGRRR